MRMRPLAGLAILVVLAGAAPATAAQAALGSHGEVYRVRAATIGDVEPTGQPEVDARTVLFFEVQASDGTTSREIVPGTDDVDVESNPTMVLEEASSAAFLLWQTKVGNAFPVLNLASRTAEGWSSVVELSGNPYAYKSTPQMLVTRDAWPLPGGELAHRTVIHIAWAEENGSGVYQTFYTPIILEDGAYIGTNVVYRVDSFDGHPSAATDLPSALLKAPRLQSGNDGSTVEIVFADADRNRVSALEVRLLPRALVALGDGARAHIIGADRLDPNTLSALAASARDFVAGANVGLQPAVTRALAEETAGFIGAWKPSSGGLVALGDAARAHIIGVGSQFGGVLRNTLADSNSMIEEVPSAVSGGTAHTLRFTLTSSRVAPTLRDASTYALFGSSDGREATVAWVDGNRLVYRESDGPSWSAEKRILLSSNLDLDQALRVLADRTNSR